MAHFAGDTGGTAPGPASPRKVALEIRRRGWLVLLATALAAAAAFGAGHALSRSWSAEAVLVVHAGGPLAAQPDASGKLAATYATLVPLDSALQNAVARARPDAANESFSASNDANTAVLRVTYQAPDSAAALAGARFVARAISGPRPLALSIAPRSVAVVQLPATATGSGSTPAQLAIVGAALGFVLGLVLIAFWRTRDARVDDARELRRLLACPCIDLTARDGAGLRPLVDALGARAGRVAVLPCRERDAHAAGAVRDQLAAALGPERVSVADPPGSPEAGELVAAEADATVLVVCVGARTLEVEEAADLLGRFGGAPAYAVLAGKRPVPPVAPLLVAEPPAATAAPSAPAS